MLFIVASHFTVHNGVTNTDLPLGFNRYLLEIGTLGNIGVILFVLISGYFIISSENSSLRQIAKISIQTFIYSFLIYILCVLFFDSRISIVEILHYSFPVLFNRYWFVTAYIVLYTLTPFLNKFLNSLSRKDYLYFLLVMILFISIIPTFTTGTLGLSNLIELILFYSIGGYLKKYPNNLLSNKKMSYYIFAISSLILFISPIAIDILGSLCSKFASLNLILFQRNSIVAILFSVSLFSIFINKKEFTNKFINIIGGCTLGVYLIHEHPLIRPLLWNEWVPVSKYVNSPYLILVLIISVLLVFTICTIIEFFRKSIFDWIQNRFLNRFIDSIQNKWEDFSDKLCNNIISKNSN